ncbi:MULTISPECIES: hypothetical protein [Burkholderia]|uniref:hypothetical protein n=1 Tax=Burkholderia TaxID=32008 RepID=UPI000683787D|nr:MULTISPECIES: hypothetical protein [Burkholderia]MDW9225864.1 hypothetical protein [Burkholderia cepacia]OMT87902.1 hypothetical protein AQ767_04660 [Burkholderia pseudomallei]
MDQHELIGQIRTIAWFHHCASEAGCEPIALTLGKVFRELAIDAPSEIDSDIEFRRYAQGEMIPTPSTLERVEKVLPGTRRVFERGPQNDTGFAPLWYALGEPLEALHQILRWYDRDLWELHLVGAPVMERVLCVTSTFLAVDPLIDAWEDLRADPDLGTLVCDWLGEHMYLLGIDHFTALVALMRISLATNSDFPFVDFVMANVLHARGKRLFDPLGITAHIRKYIATLTLGHKSVLAEDYRALASDKKLYRQAAEALIFRNSKKS